MRVAPGSYPVVLSLVQPQGWPTPLIAAAMLQFSEAPPATWHLALTPGQNPGERTEGKYDGFPLDAGSACFVSPEAWRMHAKRTPVLGVLNLPYITRISQEMEAHSDEGMWAVVELDKVRGLNAPYLTSGYGDGSYGAYWGYDADGKATSLVIDFSVIEEETE